MHHVWPLSGFALCSSSHCSQCGWPGCNSKQLGKTTKQIKSVEFEGSLSKRISHVMTNQFKWQKVLNDCTTAEIENHAKLLQLVMEAWSTFLNIGQEQNLHKWDTVELAGIYITQTRRRKRRRRREGKEGGSQAKFWSCKANNEIFLKAQRGELMAGSGQEFKQKDKHTTQLINVKTERKLSTSQLFVLRTLGSFQRLNFCFRNFV